MRFFLAFAVALVASLAATPVVRAVARKTGFVAKPRADRWHTKPTALMGGVGIFAGFLLAFFWLRSTGELQRGGLLVACAAAMFVLGFVDDLLQLKPYSKLVVQLTVAIVQTTFGQAFDWTPWLLVNQALTVFWLVGVTNALNLLDNIDGLSAGISVLASLSLAFLFASSGHPGEAQLALAFAGAALGFLCFNFHPASIFMGDSGSLFLGFFLGGAALSHDGGHTGVRGNVLSVLGPPVLVLLLPILDTTLVTVTRKLHGRPISQGGRDHTSHRLVQLGLSERGATLTLYGLAALSGLVGVLASRAPESIALAMVPVFLLVVFFVAIFLGRVKVYKPLPEGAEAERTKSGALRAQLPTFAQFGYRRRVLEVLNDCLIVLLAYYAAFLLRFDGEWVEPHFSQLKRSLPLLAVVELLTLLGSGLYGGLWRYTSLSDLRRIAGASVLSSALAATAVIFAFGGVRGFSRAVFVLNGLLLFCGIAASRLSFRLMRDWLVARADRSNKRRVLVYGAGDAGELLLRELRQNGELGMVAIGFVDDDQSKRGLVIHGVPVLGTRAQLPDLLSSHGIQDVLLSTTQLLDADLAALEALCASSQVRLRRMTISWS